MADKQQFHFPIEIEIKHNPLLEAWIEIKWELESSDIPGFFLDKTFPFALGIFYTSVKDKYPFLEELDASKVPEGMLPNAPQYRFRSKESDWPLLQLGPGIATANFGSSYTWKEFKNVTLYLQQQLLAAYQSTKLKVNTIILHYRNSYPFEFTKGNLLNFLAENLNTQIKLPNHIPGNVSETENPITTMLAFNFRIADPRSVCTIKYGTGIHREDSSDKLEKTEVIIWEFELLAMKDQVPDFYDQDSFSNWLEKAHTVIHEWFFSTIDGKLLSEFSKEKE